MSSSCHSTSSSWSRNIRRKCSPSIRERRDPVRKKGTVRGNKKRLQVLLRGTCIRTSRKRGRRVRDKGWRGCKHRWTRTEWASNNSWGTLTHLKRSVDKLWWQMRTVGKFSLVKSRVEEKIRRHANKTVAPWILLNIFRCQRKATIKNSKDLKAPSILKGYTTKPCSMLNSKRLEERLSNISVVLTLASSAIHITVTFRVDLLKRKWR